MAGNQTKRSAPYATFTAMMNFINKLRENGIPSRIDPSVFGNASGSIVYSTIAALKSLQLIDDDGRPSEEFKQFVTCEDGSRPAKLREILKKGYSGFWSDEFDLTKSTASQFDERLKEEFDCKGSTIDKAASFFIAAANFSELPISHHLKTRKASFASGSSKRSPKLRTKGAELAETPISPAPPIQATSTLEKKPLEYELIDLMKEDGIDADIKEAIWKLVQFLMARTKK